MLAVSAPVERRRSHRISVNLLSGAARLGLADTRVAPLGGRLVEIRPDFLQLAFARSDLRHLRSHLEGMCLALRLNLDGRETPIECTGRVRWTSALGDLPGTDELHLELEILPMARRDYDGIVEAARRWRRPTAVPPEAPSAEAA